MSESSVGVIAAGTEYELLSADDGASFILRSKGKSSAAHLRGEDAARFRADYDAIKQQFPARKPDQTLAQLWDQSRCTAGLQHRRRSDHGNIGEDTQDGRKLEVIGLAICLDGELEAFELIEVKMHPNRRAILATAPDATYMAGRVTLTSEEAEIVIGALKKRRPEFSRAPPRSTSASGSRRCGRPASRVSNRYRSPYNPDPAGTADHGQTSMGGCLRGSPTCAEWQCGR